VFDGRACRRPNPPAGLPSSNINKALKSAQISKLINVARGLERNSGVCRQAQSGFRRAGISICIDDMLVPKEKGAIISRAERSQHHAVLWVCGSSRRIPKAGTFKARRFAQSHDGSSSPKSASPPPTMQRSTPSTPQRGSAPRSAGGWRLNACLTVSPSKRRSPRIGRFKRVLSTLSPLKGLHTELKKPPIGLPDTSFMTCSHLVVTEQDLNVP
jgi:hypothetical protein